MKAPQNLCPPDPQKLADMWKMAKEANVTELLKNIREPTQDEMAAIEARAKELGLI